MNSTELSGEKYSICWYDNLGMLVVFYRGQNLPFSIFRGFPRKINVNLEKRYILGVQEQNEKTLFLQFPPAFIKSSKRKMFLCYKVLFQGRKFSPLGIFRVIFHISRRTSLSFSSRKKSYVVFSLIFFHYKNMVFFIQKSISEATHVYKATFHFFFCHCVKFHYFIIVC